MDEFEDDDTEAPERAHPWRRYSPGYKGRKLPRSPSPVTAEIKARIKELRSQGWTIRAICKEVGLSVQTVWKHT